MTTQARKLAVLAKPRRLLSLRQPSAAFGSTVFRLTSRNMWLYYKSCRELLNIDFIRPLNNAKRCLPRLNSVGFSIIPLCKNVSPSIKPSVNLENIRNKLLFFLKLKLILLMSCRLRSLLWLRQSTKYIRKSFSKFSNNWMLAIRISSVELKKDRKLPVFLGSRTETASGQSVFPKYLPICLIC